MRSYELDIDETAEIELDIDKKYFFPEDIKIIEHNNRYIAVYTEGVSWMVLDGKEQLDVFLVLQSGATIEEALIAHGDEATLEVLAQIEAKHFDKPSHASNNEKSLYALLTNDCNLRCAHCYMRSGELLFDELPIETWQEALSAFKRFGGTGVTFSGGEITLYEGYDKLLKFAHDIKLKVTVLSNGTLWSSQDIANSAPSIDEIQISLDGYDADSYNKIRRNSSFSRVIECIEQFDSAGVKVSVAVTPLLEDVEEFAEAFYQFAVGFIADHPNVFFKLNMELLEGREVSPTKSENNHYRETLTNLAERLYPGYETASFVFNFKDGLSRKNCGYGEITIAPNGDVYWCNRIPELNRAGNILLDSFEEILDLSEAIKASTSVDNTEPCRHCEIRYVCGGGCRLEYDGITAADTHLQSWQIECDRKEYVLQKMIQSNEYFYDLPSLG